MKPQLNIENAHMAGSETSRVICASDNVSIVSRGGDGTLKCILLNISADLITKHSVGYQDVYEVN
jgi:hypothetical protein